MLFLGTLTKSLAVCRDHSDSEPSFILDLSGIMELTGLDNIDSQSLLISLSNTKSKSGWYATVLLLLHKNNYLSLQYRLLDILQHDIDYSRTKSD